jgi:hypothetical protein
MKALLLESVVGATSVAISVGILEVVLAVLDSVL